MDDALTHDDASVTPPGTTGLRAAMARFSDGADHRRRRAVAERRLAGIDPTVLRARANELAAKVLAPTHRLDLMALVARPVPLAALTEALGATDAPAAAAAACRLALALAPPEGWPASDPLRPAAELAQLLGLPADPHDDEVSNTVALCVQAADATAGLVGLAVLAAGDDAGAAVDGVLAQGGPVLRTSRWARRDLHLPSGTVPAGHEVVVWLAAAGLPFGAGAHRCPGAEHARALACGVVAAVLASGLRPPRQEISYEARANLRIPARLILTR
jgi:cytochrome P450